jgi:hypothetical protein
VSLNHTLPISLCYSTYKVFKSQVKSPQADFLYSSSTTNFPYLSTTENWLVPEPNEFCHLCSQGTDTHHRKHVSRDHDTPLRDVTADTESTASSIVARWTLFTELLPGNALIRLVIVWIKNKLRGTVPYNERQTGAEILGSYNWSGNSSIVRTK